VVEEEYQLLSTSQCKEYIRKGGVTCPYCGSYDLQGGFVEIDQGTAKQPMTCLACSKSWHDYYELVELEEDTSDS